MLLPSKCLTNHFHACSYLTSLKMVNFNLAARGGHNYTYLLQPHKVRLNTLHLQGCGRLNLTALRHISACHVLQELNLSGRQFCWCVVCCLLWVIDSGMSVHRIQCATYSRWHNGNLIPLHGYELIYVSVWLQWYVRAVYGVLQLLVFLWSSWATCVVFICSSGTVNKKCTWLLL